MAAHVFSYTSHRKAFLTAVAMWTSVVVLEGGVIALVIVVFIDSSLLRTAVLLLLVALLAMIVGFLCAPLWTRHRLTATHVQLRYGWDSITVPRSAIDKAEPHAERLTMVQLLRAQHEPRNHRVVMALSELGQVELSLNQPYRWRINGQTHPVERIVFNVDHRDKLLAALNVPPVAPMQTTERPATTAGTLPTASTTPQRHPALDASPSSPIGIYAEGLTRRFNSFVAVDGLNLAVAAGEVYGFLGPNGAGKTSTIRMLVGLLEPSAGRVLIAGQDMWVTPLAAKRALGYVPDRAVVYERLSGREFLHFLAQMRGIPLTDATQRIDALLNLLELRPHSDRLCGAYSFGMQRKLALAGALLHQPPVLILDEPLNGLDPLSMRRLKQVFAELAAGGTTVLLSTHDLATAETVCHRVGVVHNGRLIAEGPPDRLRDVLAAPDLEAVFFRLLDESHEVSG